MGTSLSAARDAVQAQIKARIPTLRVYDTVPGTVQPPALVVAPNPGTTADYQIVMGADDVTWTVRAVVIVGTAVDRAAQDAMDAYLSPSGPLSVPAAIRSDPTLGGVTDWAVVTTAERYGLMSYAGQDYLGCEILVEVSG